MITKENKAEIERLKSVFEVAFDNLFNYLMIELNRE